MNAAPLAVVIADDDANVRNALSGLLDDSVHLRVVGVAGTGEEATTLCAIHQPAVALLDVMMPGGGEPAVRAIRAAAAGTKVVIYTARSDRSTRERMLAAGAVAVFVKGAPIDLVDALVDVGRSDHAVGS